MFRLSQNDYRWERIRLGPSSLTVGGHGCLTTCISMGISKFYPYEFSRLDYGPGKLARYLNYTDDDHEYGPGLILWNQENLSKFEHLGMEYIGRYRSFDPYKDIKMIHDFAQSEDHFPVLEVLTRYGNKHWVAPVGRAFTWRGIGWASNDPWDGSRQWKTVGIGAPYKYELGWLLFKKLPSNK